MSIEELQALIMDCVNTCLEAQSSPNLKEPNPKPNNVTAEYFCNTLGYMALNTFYQRAPKELIPGAFKVGSRWFIDVQEFEQRTKEAMKSE